MEDFEQIDDFLYFRVLIEGDGGTGGGKTKRETVLSGQRSGMVVEIGRAHV